jgi:hypothetical protein
VKDEALVRLPVLGRIACVRQLSGLLCLRQNEHSSVVSDAY